MARSGFKAEKVIAVMFAACILLLVSVPIVDRIGAAPQTLDGETMAEAMRRTATEDEGKNRLRPVANILFYSGLTGITVTLAAGLAIA